MTGLFIEAIYSHSGQAASARNCLCDVCAFRNVIPRSPVSAEAWNMPLTGCLVYV